MLQGISNFRCLYIEVVEKFLLAELLIVVEVDALEDMHELLLAVATVHFRVFGKSVFKE